MEKTVWGDSGICVEIRRAGTEHFKWTVRIRPAGHERKNSRNGNERSRNTGYRSGPEHFARHSHIRVKKTEKYVKQVNEGDLKSRERHSAIDIDSESRHSAGAEMDEIWSYYHDKSRHIAGRAGNVPLAFTFGTREYRCLDERLSLLRACSKSPRVYLDG